MEVTFTKLPGRRYPMTVARERGPELAPRQGPGYHDHIPHDAVHFLAEAEARLAGGAFGRIADGQRNIFSPADPALRRREHRREKKHRPTPAQHADMGRSEELAGLCQVLWEMRAGLRDCLPEWAPGRMPPQLPRSPLAERILARLDELAARWRALPAYGSVNLTWPGTGPRRRSP